MTVTQERFAGTVLAKANVDHWQYMVVLKSGVAIVFTDAQFVNNHFVRLNYDDGASVDIETLKTGFPKCRGIPIAATGRGIEVALDEIQCLMDGDS